MINKKRKCWNHPQRDSLSMCHSCGKYFCEDCLVDGDEFYFCKEEGCQLLFIEKYGIKEIGQKNDISVEQRWKENSRRFYKKTAIVLAIFWLLLNIGGFYAEIREPNEATIGGWIARDAQEKFKANQPIVEPGSWKYYMSTAPVSLLMFFAVLFGVIWFMRVFFYKKYWWNRNRNSSTKKVSDSLKRTVKDE